MKIEKSNNGTPQRQTRDEAKAELKPKAKRPNMPAEPKKTFNRDEVPVNPQATNASSAASQIKTAAEAQARKDAGALMNYGRQCYEAELGNALVELMGGTGGDSVAAYFQASPESWAAPNAANPQQLESVTVSALPSAD